MADYSINLTNGHGTTEDGVPVGKYAIALSNVNEYQTTLYDGPAGNTVTEATVTAVDGDFKYYVQAGGTATVRLLDSVGGTPIAGITGVKVRRSNAAADAFYGGIYNVSSTAGTVDVLNLPYYVNGETAEGPDISITINTATLQAAGYVLVTPTASTITHKIKQTGTTFDFIVAKNVQSVSIYDKNAGIYADIDGDTPTGYLPIGTGTFKFTGPNN